MRERKSDIFLLLNHFRQVFNRQYGKKVEGFTDEALAILMDYDWPGNIRELKNLVEVTLIFADKKITIADFPESFRRCLLETKGLYQDERTRLINALFETNWNKARAAQKLNWSRMTLYRKLAKYGVDPDAAVIEQSMEQILQAR